MSEEFVPESGVTDDDRLWALLAYLLAPIVPIIILLMEDKKDRPFIKAHNAQALAWSIVASVIIGVLSLIVIGCFLVPVYLIITIIWAVKAYKGEYVEIPVITKFCKDQGWA
jgi:uncharacterized membrane protein